MLDQADVAADLNRLHSLEHAGVDMDSLLLDLGKIVELKHAIAAAKFGSSMPVRTFTATDMADMAQLARRQLRLAIDTVRHLLAAHRLNPARLSLSVLQAYHQSCITRGRPTGLR